jgi:hypothetical protein
MTWDHAEADGRLMIHEPVSGYIFRHTKLPHQRSRRSELPGITEVHGRRHKTPPVNYITKIWHNLAERVAYGLSVWLAAGVVPWHTFNFVGFGPVNLQACHSKDQGSCGEAETFGFFGGGVDLLGQALTFAWK